MTMACLLGQPQPKLQLDYKTTTTQIHQKIKLYGSLTTRELKKPHSSRRLGEVEMQRHAGGATEVGRRGDMGWAVPHPHVVGKDREGNLRIEGTQPHTRPPSSGFQYQKDKSP